MATIADGFVDPAQDAQRVFRSLLNATAEPGTIHNIDGPLPPPPLSRSSWAIALTLFDHDTPVWIDKCRQTEDLCASLAFHCGCPIIDDCKSAAFAFFIGAEQFPSLTAFDHGTGEMPHQSSTIIWDIGREEMGPTMELSGPGIDGARPLALPRLAAEFLPAWHVNNQSFPTGLDLFIVVDDGVIGLPRTVRIVPTGS